MQTRHHLDHSRHWQQNLYVYPVISRRSGGLSIGVNLNPDTACNFDCIYCQVDRTVEPKTRKVDLAILKSELSEMIQMAQDGALFQSPPLQDVPVSLRRLNDIAFSGDGEPTACPVFKNAVALAAELKAQASLETTKIVLITDACYLTKPDVTEALDVMDRNNGEIWAKLDAGTEEYFKKVNKPSHSLDHVLENITEAARIRPVVIQSLFLRLDDAGPPAAEIAAFCSRLRSVTSAGGRISYVQVYTVARKPAQANVSALCDEEVDSIRDRIVDETGLQAVSFYSG